MKLADRLKALEHGKSQKVIKIFKKGFFILQKLVSLSVLMFAVPKYIAQNMITQTNFALKDSSIKFEKRQLILIKR